uniref:Laminin domain-containing protein n=1 Tax=Arion vulgaris TaxID=1028688 RepID=A0A0B7B1R5_9EUPU
MQEIPAIQETINNARRQTEEARESLAYVVADARRALELARKAEATATQASNEAGDIHNKASVTKDRASKLRQDSDTLSKDVLEAETTLNGYESQVGQDEDLAKKALQEAAAAKQRAQEAYDQVNEAYGLVKSIRDDLSNLGSVDLQQLMALEKQLDEVEKQMADSDIANKMNELMKKNKYIEEQADRFDLDLSELQAAVANIGDIKNSLPLGCFKTIPIEKPAR